MQTKPILDSNDPQTTIHWSCWECGVTANALTCLKRFGQPLKQVAFDVSTYHTGTCGFCHEKKEVTQTRDFFFPDYGLIKKTVQFLQTL